VWVVLVTIAEGDRDDGRRAGHTVADNQGVIFSLLGAAPG
jgi:hypothetical protein